MLFPAHVKSVLEVKQLLNSGNRYWWYVRITDRYTNYCYRTIVVLLRVWLEERLDWGMGVGQVHYSKVGDIYISGGGKVPPAKETATDLLPVALGPNVISVCGKLFFRDFPAIGLSVLLQAFSVKCISPIFKCVVPSFTMRRKSQREQLQ